MIYGLYLSADGIMTSMYKQDVISNNLANAETTGFKRDVPAFRQRLTAAQEDRSPGEWSDPILEGIGGSLTAQPNDIDFQQGEIAETGSPLDVALQGNGFFGVQENGKTFLTRDGRFQLDRNGTLTLISGQPVLDSSGRTINLSADSPVKVDHNGNIIQNGQSVGSIGVFDVSDKTKLTKMGNGLYANAGDLIPSTATIHDESLEASNVDPTTEMAELMDTQRQLEANANMIKTQDSTLQLLVNNVGKIS